jgi:hypothetical protein
MWPVLRGGDQVVVRHGAAPPQVGDIVVLRTGRHTVVHRAVALRRSGEGFLVRTKGDASPFADRGWVGSDRILGIVDGVMAGGVRVTRSGVGGWLASFIARFSRLQDLAFLPLRVLTMGRRGGGMG